MKTVVGVDAHKRTHTLVAVNPVGRKLGEKTVSATTLGHSSAMMWVRARYGRDVVWGVEDCRPLTALLERELLAAAKASCGCRRTCEPFPRFRANTGQIRPHRRTIGCPGSAA